MRIYAGKEHDQYTVAELEKALEGMPENLPVSIYVMKELDDGTGEGVILPLEAVGTNGLEVSLTGFDS